MSESNRACAETFLDTDVSLQQEQCRISEVLGPSISSLPAKQQNHDAPENEELGQKDTLNS